MLEHIALWTYRLEEQKAFYCSYFKGTAGQIYESESEFHAQFASYFISFPAGSRLEIMQMPGIANSAYQPGGEAIGLTHLAFAVETKEEVDALVQRAYAENRTVLMEPHMTGDLYYEACILDPDGNRVEVVVVPE